MAPTLAGVSAQGGTLARRYFLSDLSAGPNSATTVSARSINDFGQVLVNTSTGEPTGAPSIWTPAAPNAVSGTRTLVPMPIIPASTGPFGTIPAHPTPAIGNRINNRGQVAGTLNNYSAAFLWTPSTPQGLTGDFTTLQPITGGSNRLIGAWALNNRGDVAVSTSTTAGNYLYSAAIPNSPVLTPTQLPASLNNYQPFALNDAGDIALYSGSAGGAIFRPSTPNGATGAISIGPAVRDLNNAGLAATHNGVYRVAAGAMPTMTTVISDSIIFNAVSDSGLAISGVNAWSAADGLVDLNGRLEAHSSARWSISRLLDINVLGQAVGEGMFDPDNNPATSNSVMRPILLTPLIDGDATIDQHVDFADLVLLAQHYGQTSGQTWQTGDFDGNNAIDFADLVLLAQNYDTNSAVDSGFAADWALAQSLVPEPASLSMLLGAAIVLRRRQRM